MVAIQWMKRLSWPLKSGVTTVAAGPGSANVIGGTFFAYKTAGHCIDEMTIQNPLAMKAHLEKILSVVIRERKLIHVCKSVLF